MRLQVPIYGQRDPQVAATLLGTSNSTIGDYGCLLTALAMLCKYYGKNVDPISLNQMLINIGGYLNGNLYKWYEGITKIFSDIVLTKLQITTYKLTDVDFNAIKAEIDAGRPVIIEVDFNPSTAIADMHFVLLTGYDGDTYYVNDPWYGDNANLNRYGVPAITIQRYVFHSGPVQANNSSDTIPVLKTDFENLVTKATALDNQNPTYAQLKQILTEINNQLDGLKGENKSLNEFMQKIATMLGVAATQEKIIGDLTETLSNEQDATDCAKEKEQLEKDLEDANTKLQTKELERKTAAEEVLKVTNTNIDLTKKLSDMTIDRNKYKDLYEKSKDDKGTLAEFTKREMLSYLINNWFNKKAFSEEKT